MGRDRGGIDLMSGIGLVTAGVGPSGVILPQIEVTVTSPAMPLLNVSGASGQTYFDVVPTFPGGASGNYTFTVGGDVSSNPKFRLPPGDGRQDLGYGMRFFLIWANLSVGELATINLYARADRTSYQRGEQAFSVTVQRTS